jgi:hypothetical protein
VKGKAGGGMEVLGMFDIAVMESSFVDYCCLYNGEGNNQPVLL